MKRFLTKSLENETRGEPEVVVLSGPLSEAYTQALNLVFAKTDNQPVEGDGIDTSGELKSAVETMANDYIMAEANQMVDSAAEDEAIKKLYVDVGDVMTVQSDNDSLSGDVVPDTLVFTPTGAGALSPDMVASVLTQVDKGASDVVVALDTSDSTLREPMVSGSDRLTAVAAIESLYGRAGVTVVRGLESLVAHLAKRARARQ